MTNPVVPMPSSSQQEVVQAARRPAIATALPSILGMYAFAAGTFIVAARMTHWYGNTRSAIVLFPLVLILGGLTQFYAGVWSLRANDATSMSLHCTWGSFWTAFGLLELLYSVGWVPRPQGSFSELGFWFVVMAAITWGIAFSARENKGLTTVLSLLAIGSTLEAIAELAGIGWLRILAGYFLIVSAIAAWCVATNLVMRAGSLARSAKLEPVAAAAPVRGTESARVA